MRGGEKRTNISTKKGLPYPKKLCAKWAELVRAHLHGFSLELGDYTAGKGNASNTSTAPPRLEDYTAGEGNSSIVVAAICPQMWLQRLSCPLVVRCHHVSHVAACGQAGRMTLMEHACVPCCVTPNYRCTTRIAMLTSPTGEKP